MAPTVSGVLFGIGQLGLTLSVFGYFSDSTSILFLSLPLFSQ